MFKKSKNLKGMFTSNIINNAIKNYLNKNLRDAARHYGLDHTTIRNYAIRAGVFNLWAMAQWWATVVFLVGHGA